MGFAGIFKFAAGTIGVQVAFASLAIEKSVRMIENVGVAVAMPYIL